ncbi:MAG: multiple sugar transport system permease protein [Candidatus Atribacteria bacterium]|nr:multiple sugar transport system permease protein [Candidatus Atribacteria bacterium]
MENHGGPRLTMMQKETRLGALLLMPAIIVMLIVIAYPFIYSIIISFLRWHAVYPDHPWVGFTNYIKVITDSRFPITLRNTAIYALVGTAGKMIIGMILALILNKQFWGRGVVRGLFILPWIIPMVSAATTWRWMFAEDGVVNFLLQRLNIISQPIIFLGDKQWALAAVLVVGIWKGYPLFMTMILAGLQNIPGELYEAAEVDGANGLQKFFYITIPSLRYVLITAIILSVIWTFNAFNVVWLMTKGGPSNSTHILNTLAYEYGFVGMRYDYAAALAVMTLAILAVFLYFFAKLQKVEE